VKISIIVPAFNEEKLLQATLRSVRAAAAALEARAWAVEFIVCDNNSTDRTAEIARAAGAAVVFEPVNQISGARNTGAARATGDWLVFVDADSLPARELFEEVAAAIAGGRCVAGGATVMIETDRASARMAVGIWNVLSRVCRWAAGSFIFCEAAAFREVGGFSTQLYAGEEIDLFGRLKRLARDQGREIVILHRHPLATSDRKLRLYSLREYLSVILKVAISGGRVLRERDSCYPWYDGRR
jgi:glycosyltransferase involved in cell wall biosynthesis